MTIKNSVRLLGFRLDKTQDESEPRSKVYLTYTERVAQITTQRLATSGGSAAGSASWQTNAAKGQQSG